MVSHPFATTHLLPRARGSSEMHTVLKSWLATQKVVVAGQTSFATMIFSQKGRDMAKSYF